MNHRIWKTSFLSVVVGGLLLISSVGCQNKTPSIDGNYILDHRVLPDGKQQRWPDVAGLMTMHDGYRNFNVYWSENGKPLSISTIARYWFDGHQYTEESVYYMENRPDTAPKYITTPQRASASVTEMDGKMQFKLPLHGEPDVTFTEEGMTATRAGAFTDYWKRVK